MKHLVDTIAAIATPYGSGGVGVVRISGDQVVRLSRTLIESFPQQIIPSHVYHSWVTSGGRRVDEVIYYYMKAPHSYTGEDVVEINCHGGRAILRMVLELVIAAGARQAERGEFTRRAFMNGKIDLVQAEAVLDLVSARSDDAAAAAASQLAGRVSKKVDAIRGPLLSFLAEVEAEMDFPDDVSEADGSRLEAACRAAMMGIDALLATAAGGRILREGVRVAIVGRPNVGKSSLLNALIGADRAIVSHLPGTTRDTIEEGFVHSGIPFLFIDTAGLRRPSDQLEAMGIARAEAQAAMSDIVLVVFDVSQPWQADDADLLSRFSVDKCLGVFNKIDLGSGRPVDNILPSGRQAFVSALTGEGIDELKDLIAKFAGRDKIVESAGGMINMRHEECLLRAREALARVLGGSNGSIHPELVSIDLRQAVAALGEVSGHQVSAEVIDQIFAKFCVGK